MRWFVNEHIKLDAVESDAAVAFRKELRARTGIVVADRCSFYHVAGADDRLRRIRLQCA